MTRRRRLQPASESTPYRWIAEQHQFDGLVEQLVSTERIALDTEFHRERTYWPQLALVQIRVGGDIFLIDPVEVDISGLRATFGGPLFVMHAASQDLEVLERACGDIPQRLFDTQVAAGFVGLSTPSLSTLVEKFVGQRLPKGDRLTDWFERPLHETQRSYAASDVAHLFEIHDILLERLSTTARLPWAEAECELARVPNRPAVPPDLSWTRIKEARHLRGTARSIASVLARWRELTAQRTDVPARFVLSDLGLVGIAQRAPKSHDALRKIRGVDGRFLRDGAADQILALIREGAEMAPEDVPTLAPDQGPALEQEFRPAVTLVSAWLAQLAKDVNIDPGLLATRSDITDVLRGAPDARLSTGWRKELAGEAIADLVEGRAALAFDRSGGLVLERRDPAAGADDARILADDDRKA